MSHWLSHAPAPGNRDTLMAHPGWKDCTWWNLPEEALLEHIKDENQRFEDFYPCDDQCHDWLDELMAMACRYEDIIAPRKAPWARGAGDQA